MDDAALLAGVVAGDERALERLLGRYWVPLAAYAERLLDDRDAADDVASETFTRLWNRRDALGGVASVRSYLYRLARNLTLDQLRRLKARERLATVLERIEMVPARTPDDIAELDELQAAMEKAIQSLPARRQEIFVLGHLHGLSYRQIADVMGIAEQTVKNQMSRALAALREALEPLLEDP